MSEIKDLRPTRTVLGQVLPVALAPLVSHRALDWTALIDAKTAELVGYVHLDGFLAPPVVCGTALMIFLIRFDRIRSNSSNGAIK